MAEAVVKNSSLSREQLESLAADILAEAKRQGATAAEAAVSIETGLSVTARLGEVETIEHNHDKGLGLTVYVGQCKGSASSSDFSPTAVKDAVAAACRIARYTAADEYAGLADAALMATEFPDLELNHPWAVDAEQSVDIALACEGAARDVDPRIVNSEGATVTSHQSFRIYANSHDFMGSQRGTSHSISCAVVGEQDGAMQRDYWYSADRVAERLESPEQVGRRSAERTLRRLGGRQLATCQVPVLFEAEVAGSLISSFISAIRGTSQYRKSSFLLDSLGQQIFPSFMHIHEQPRLLQAAGSAVFDREGVATQARDFIQAGVLESYVLGSYSARRLALQSTANAGGTRNLTVDPGSVDGSSDGFNALLQRMGRGLLVTEMMGSGANIVTGDYSRGAAGFWVENGELQYPVEEITIAGNLKDIFMGIEAVGSDVDLRGNTRTGSILVQEMMVAGA